MRLTVHIGSHKAGSTAIQTTCLREAGLLEGKGVYYPIDLFPKFPVQHSELAALLERGGEGELDIFADRIKAEAAERGLSHIFLSGEDLCSATSPDGADRLASALRGRFEEVAIVLVLRRKYDYLLSHFNHFLRHVADPVGMEDFRRSLSFSPRRTVEIWSAAFSPEAIEVFPYDSPPGGQPLLQRFFSAILDVAIPEETVKANAAVNASFDLLSAIVVNEAVKALPDFDLTDVNLAYIDAFRNSRGRMPVFEADIASRINDLFPDADWLIDGLPGLTAAPRPAVPLEPEAARKYVVAAAKFMVNLRGLYGEDDPEAPLGRGDIVSAYRCFLGRAPARDELDRMVRARKTMSALREMVLDSPEFRRVHRERLNVAGLDLPALDVSVAATETQQRAMFDHLQRRWKKLGTERAHWSVWSEPTFAGTITPKLEEEFFRTGAEEFQVFRQTLARAGRTLSDIRRLVDFGCGLGRFTVSAAKEIPEVLGIDFSSSHLEKARVAAHRQGVESIQWIERRGLESPDAGTYEAWYSRIVLQHNPPSLIDRWLREGLGGLAEGGIAVFQVPTYSVNYSFAPETYLQHLDEHPEIEMHCLPQGFILRLLDEVSCRLLELREDNAIDFPRYWVSNTFVVERRGSGLT
jgi:SAM-dependent methyltransferase